MELYSYNTYDEYLESQIQCNMEKQRNIWVRTSTLDYICDFMKGARTGICHGVRTGFEVDYLREKMICNVIGTEIGIIENDNIIQWDFHKIKKEWINHFDFLYSNSLDHAYRPDLAFMVWGCSIKVGGYIFIEHSNRHIESTKEDPFGIEFDELVLKLEEWGRGLCEIVHIHDFEDRRETKLIIMRRYE